MIDAAYRQTHHRGQLHCLLAQARGKPGDHYLMLTAG